MTKSCLFHTINDGCGSKFKPEHIIQEGLGGSLKSSEIICADCNKYFGDNVDPVVTGFFKEILLVLSPLLPGDLKRKKLYTESIRDSTPLLVAPGGRVEVRKISKRRVDEDGDMIEIKGPLGAKRSDLERIAGARAQSFERCFEKDDYRINYSINEVLVRAIMLDLLEILKYATIQQKIPNIANHPCLEDLKRWVRHGTQSWNFPPKQVPFAPISDLLDILFSPCTFSHRLAIIYDHKMSKMLFSAQFVNTMPFVVVLDEVIIDKTSLSVLYQKVLLDDAKSKDSLNTIEQAEINIADLEWRKFSTATKEAQEFALREFYKEYSRRLGKAHYELDMRSCHTLCKDIRDYQIKYKTVKQSEAVINTICDLVGSRYIHSPYLNEIKGIAHDITKSRFYINSRESQYTLEDIISIYRDCLKAIAANKGYGYPEKRKFDSPL